MNQIKQYLPGIGLCLAIAIPSFVFGKLIPVVGGPVFGIVIGMIIAAIKRPSHFEMGIKYTSKKILQYAIILLGFEMNLYYVFAVGADSLAIIISTLTTSFLVAFFASKALRIDGKIATLVGVGTSICGGSAIAATAPVIGASDEEIAHSISTIFLFNIIAVFIFPALGHLFGLSDTGFGVWAGTAINDTSSVVAAGVSWSETAGNTTALQLATIVKLTRTLMIVPITLVLAVYTSKKTVKAEGSTFRFAKIFPWFVLGFLAAAMLNTFLPIPQSVSGFLVSAGKFMIVMAMSAIGLNTNLKKLLTNGIRPIVLGFLCWIAVAGMSLLVQHLTGMI
ncbi:MAG: YeiH family protein [Anaerofustis sp.]